MAVQSRAVARTSLVLCCLVMQAACTSGGEADPSVPPVSTTAPGPSTTTTPQETTTTTTAPAVLTLTDYLIAVIKSVQTAGLTEAANTILTEPTEDAYRV